MNWGWDIYGPAPRKNRQEPSQTKKPSTGVLVPGVVVPSPCDVESRSRDRKEAWDTRMRATGTPFGPTIERILRRRDMGKIYGAHSSYCAIFRAGGDNKKCSCNAQEVEIGDVDRSGMRILAHDAMHEANRQMRASDYASDFCESFKKVQPDVTSETLAKVHKVMKDRWLECHPSDAPPAAPEPPDGPGEEDGPWAEGWGERAGVPEHREWFEKNRGELREMPVEAIGRMWRRYYKWDLYKGLPPGSKPDLPPKDDAQKSKPFKFFIQQFPLTLIEVARHMEHGCNDPGHVFLGWQDVENGFERYTDAMHRHQLEEVIATVTNTDQEEGVDRGWAEETHAVAVAANALIRLELLLRKRRSLNLARDATP